MAKSVTLDTWHEIIDYAGLFPPAGLSLSATLANYDEYARSPEHWMLGRLIIPLPRLVEMTPAGSYPAGPVSCLWPAETLHSDAAIQDALARTEAGSSAGGRRVDSIEVMASEPDGIARLARGKSSGYRWFVEVPLDDQLPQRLDAIRAGELRAKVRTGSVRRADIPGTPVLAEFLQLVAERQLGFKCTAGLHHPFPAVRPLTYEPDAPRGRMHGFVNVLVATVVARHRGGDLQRLQQALNDDDPHSFQMSDQGLRWHDMLLSPWELADTRNHAFLSFGSCSFREPVDDLRALHWLAPTNGTTVK